MLSTDEARDRIAQMHAAARVRQAQRPVGVSQEDALALVAEGPPGQQGEPGERGPEGPQGPEGPRGPQGDEGVRGDDGDDGKAGPPGPKGEKGDDGPAGKQGKAGKIGPGGFTGPASTVPGPAGPAGAAGPGVPTGGTAGQYLRKTNSTDFVDAWASIPSSEITGLGTLATQSGTFSGTHSGASSGTNTGDQTISITGDVTAPGSAGVLTATLPTVGTPGTYGDATHVPQFTTDAKGRVTAVTAVLISGGSSGGRTFAFFQS